MNKHPLFNIHPPKGTSFRECLHCNNPYCYDGNSYFCLWCIIHNPKIEELYKELPEGKNDYNSE